MKEIKITIGGRDKMGPEAPMNEMLDDLEEGGEALYDKMAPTGDFSKKSLNNLVSATNRLLPAFGQSADYPTFAEDLTKLPTDFVRVISMFADAVDDAIEEEVVDGGLSLSLDNITDDLSLTAAASKIDALSRNKDFKKFLKEPYSEKEEEKTGSMMEEDVMDDATMDSLMMDRM